MRSRNETVDKVAKESFQKKSATPPPTPPRTNFHPLKKRSQTAPIQTSKPFSPLLKKTVIPQPPKKPIPPTPPEQRVAAEKIQKSEMQTKNSESLVQQRLRFFRDLENSESQAPLPRSTQKLPQPTDLPQLKQGFQIELLGIVQYLSEFYETLFKIFEQPVGEDNLKGISAFLSKHLLNNKKRSINDTLIFLFTPMMHIYNALKKLKFSGNYHDIFIDEYKILEPKFSIEQASKTFSQLYDFVFSKDFFESIVPSSLALQIISNPNYNPEFSLEGKINNDLFFNTSSVERCLALTGMTNMKGYLEAVFSKVSQFLPFLSTRTSSLLHESQKNSDAFHDFQAKTSMIQTKLKMMLDLGNQYCGDVIRIIEEEKSIDIIVPSKSRYHACLASWQERAKINSILFIFNSEKSQWYAVLTYSSQTKKKKHDFEIKVIPDTSPYFTALIENDSSKVKQKVKLLLRENPIFDRHNPQITGVEVSNRNSMNRWDTELKPRTTTTTNLSSSSFTTPNTTRKSSITGTLSKLFQPTKEPAEERTVTIHATRVLQLMLRCFKEHRLEKDNNNTSTQETSLQPH